MFCSFCRKVNELEECRRKICPFGHVACEKCDDNLKKCPECLLNFSNYVSIEFMNGSPRLAISNLPAPLEISSTPTKIQQALKSSQSETDSLEHILDEIKEYEANRHNLTDENPIFGCFEVVGETIKSTDTQFFLDSEEEHEIFKCFKVCPDKQDVKKTQEPTKIPVSKRQVPKCAHRLTNRAMQTSVMEVSPVLAARSSKDFSCTLSQDFYVDDPFDDGEVSNSNSSKTVLELYKNDRPVEESETAHFTSLTVSHNYFSPPVSPPKKFYSTAQRAKFASFFDRFHKTPRQFEPLSVYEVKVSASSDNSPTHTSTKLPRFPVRCPITNCDSFNVPSDYCNHVTIDHPHVEVAKVTPAKTFNLNLNHKGNSGIVVCQRLFLLSDKISDIGYGAFENCLPIVLLTTKMSFPKAFGYPSSASKPSEEKFFIWLHGVYQFPIDYTLTVYVHSRDDYEPTIIKSITSSVLFMNRPFNPKEVAVISYALSSLELQSLTNNGKKMLSCQIVFH